MEKTTSYTLESLPYYFVGVIYDASGNLMTVPRFRSESF